MEFIFIWYVMREAKEKNNLQSRILEENCVKINNQTFTTLEGLYSHIKEEAQKRAYKILSDQNEFR